MNQRYIMDIPGCKILYRYNLSIHNVLQFIDKFDGSAITSNTMFLADYKPYRRDSKG